MTLSEAVFAMEDDDGYIPGLCQEAIIVTFGGEHFARVWLHSSLIVGLP